MRIRFSNSSELFVSFTPEKIPMIELFNFPGTINLQKEVKNFLLRRKGVHVTPRSIEADRKDYFYILTKKPLLTVDILQFACWIEKKYHRCQRKT